MDPTLHKRNSEAFFFFFFGVIVLFVALSFYKYVVAHDFTISNEAECNPLYEECFARPCDPAYEECSENGELIYFKYITYSAKSLPTCDDRKTTCPGIDCSTDTMNCEEEYCDEDLLTDAWTTCVGPLQ